MRMAGIHSLQEKHMNKEDQGRHGEDSPEEEIRMGHEVGDALEHAARLEDEGRERHTRQIHADSSEG